MTGARIKINTIFPDVKIEIDTAQEKDILSMNLYYENSYDSTTGVRMIIEARRKDGTLFVIREKLGSFYHRHTKGLDLIAIKQKLEKGVSKFLNEIQKQLQRLADTPVSKLGASLHFTKYLSESSKAKLNKKDDDDYVKNDTDKIPAKYIEMVLKELNKESVVVNNIYDLYGIISMILTKEISSDDTRRQHANNFSKRLEMIQKEAAVRLAA